jgi:arylsulfatase A
LEAAGIDYAAHEFDGKSLLTAASGKATLQRDALYWHYPHYCYHGMNDMGSVIRCGDYKYIHHYDNADHELFDLKTDIGETVNLYSTQPAKAAELKAKLMAWLKATDAQLPRLYVDIPDEELPGRKRTVPAPQAR